MKRLVSSDILELPIDNNEKSQPYQLLNSVNSYRKTVDYISSYHKMYKQNLVNPSLVKDELVTRLNTHISMIYKKINVDNADINYYLDNIYSNKKTKFYDIIDQMEIIHIIKMLDYGREYNSSSSNYKFLMDEYNKLFNIQIINGKFGKSNKLISQYMLDNWVQINFDSLLNYTEVLSKLKYHNYPTTEYDLIIQNKFDDITNITKLLDYIKKIFCIINI